MASDTEQPRLVEIARHLLAHDVAFIVIGGQAAALLGSPLATFDVDLCYARTPENLERLASALTELNPRLRDVPEDLPFSLDARSLALGSNFTFETSLGPLDLLAWVEPLGAYGDLLPGSERYRVGDIELDVIGLADLIAIKRHLGRPKDQATLQQLLALRDLGDQEPRG